MTVAPEVPAESQGYPFFLQLWGAALRRQLQVSGATTLTPTHVAAAVAATLANRTELPNATLRAALGAAPPDATDALRVQTELDALADLGYIWRPPTARGWTPGISSLMNYVRAPTGPPPPS